MPTYGAYKSVNKLTHFAAIVAEHGPFDPKERVFIRLTRDGRYTINGVDAFGEDGKPKSGLDLRLYVNNTLNGVRYISNGQLQIDSDGRRYIVYISDANGQILPYSILMAYKNDPNVYYTEWIDLPSDHPFLQAFKNV